METVNTVCLKRGDSTIDRQEQGLYFCTVQFNNRVYKIQASNEKPISIPIPLKAKASRSDEKKFT